MNKNILTKVIPTSLVVAAAFSLMGCTVTKTETYTETHTDANGNTTTYSSTTVSDENGTTTTESYSSSDDELIVATLSIENESGKDFTEMYFTTFDATEWGPEILGENAPLANGEVITYPDALTYTNSDDGAYWSLLAVGEDGEQVPFDAIDVREAADSQNVKIVINFDEASNACTVTVE